jgi:hypothetical protein
MESLPRTGRERRRFRLSKVPFAKIERQKPKAQDKSEFRSARRRIPDLRC